MKGLELARRYYEAYGKDMLKEQFPDLLPFVAVGLVGSGSECLGFDDDLSEDHDFEPGFCIFLPGEAVVDRKEAFRLERAYAKLPKEFMGYQRNLVAPTGGTRHGVIRTADFYAEKAGIRDGRIDTDDWFGIPSYALREATDGEVFYDGLGEFTEIRKRLSVMPEDVRLKKIAGHALLMAQSGQYNFPRILKRNEKAAAQLAVFEFVTHALEVIFLLNKAYMPYYKWSFRALRDLDLLSYLEEPLYEMMITDNEDPQKKSYMIEDVAMEIIAAMQVQEITKATCGDLEKHAYSVNDQIRDADIRNRNILYAV